LSLKSLQLAHGIAFLALVIITGIVGAAALELRREASRETLRLNQLLTTVHETRGDLYRQMKEVFYHHFLADPHAREQYLNFDGRIAASFERLTDLASGAEEKAAIADLERAYAAVGREVDAIMGRTTAIADEAEAFAVFDEQLEGQQLSGFEEVIDAAEALIVLAREAADARVERLTRFSALLLLVPIALAGGLLLFARAFLKRAFVKPMHALVRATDEYRVGRLDHRVPETGVAEVATLERAFNGMAHDLKRSRAALVRSEKQAALGALMPVIAHNIRNPLASIRAVAQVLRDPGLPADTREGLGDIVRTVDRLETWLTSLLSYLNPTTPSKVTTTLTETADEALMLLRPKLDEKALMPKREGWTEAPAVSIDRHLMEQAVTGLLTNAIEASPQGGVITLTAAEVDGQARLAVTDEGPGIPFVPVPGGLAPGPTTKAHGSGLGIPFAFKICEIHGGALDFETPEGGGTRAVITVPTATAPRAAQRSAA